MGFGQGDSDASAARTEIYDLGADAAPELRVFQNGIDQLLGFGAGDEGAFIAFQHLSHKIDFANDVLYGFVSGDTLEATTQGAQKCVGKRFVAAHI